MGRKIAVLGKAPDSAQLAPFDDPTWEIWSINDSLYRQQIPRAERQFELHPIEWTKEPEYDEYYQWLTSCPIPVYLQSPVPEIVNGVVYPLNEVISHFAGPGANYFTNSISYMIALAIMELDNRTDGSDPEDNAIGLWGVNMAQHGVGGKSEYAAQRPSCEFWCGMARGRRYQLELPEVSDLLGASCLYGFDMSNKVWEKFRAREKELKARIDNADAVERRAHDESVFLRGALEAHTYYQQWMHPTGVTAK